MKKILITGINGFIGDNIFQSLKLKYEVWGCGKRPISICDKYFKWNIAEPYIYNDELPSEFDIIIHAAAETPCDAKSFNNYYNTNVRGTENIISFARDHKVKKIIFFGTVSSYGKVDGEVLHAESGCNSPRDYGLTKYISQKLIENCDIIYDIIILPGVVGRGCNNSWIVNTALKLKLNENVKCYNSKGYFNNILEISDLVSFIEKRVETYSGSSKFLLGSREKKTIEEIVSYMKEKLSSTSEIEYISDGRGFTLDVADTKEYNPKKLMQILDIVCCDIKQRI